MSIIIVPSYSFYFRCTRRTGPLCIKLRTFVALFVGASFAEVRSDHERSLRIEFPMYESVWVCWWCGKLGVFMLWLVLVIDVVIYYIWFSVNVDCRVLTLMNSEEFYTDFCPLVDKFTDFVARRFAKRICLKSVHWKS